jgi:hypothetical protein
VVLKWLVWLRKNKMVFFGVKIKHNGFTDDIIGEFNSNLVNKNVANVMFKEGSHIGFVTDDVVLIYLDPTLNKIIPLFLCFILLATGIIFNMKWVVYPIGFILLTLFSFKYLIYFLLKKSLRKKGFKDEVKII